MIERESDDEQYKDSLFNGIKCICGVCGHRCHVSEGWYLAYGAICKKCLEELERSQEDL